MVSELTTGWRQWRGWL